MKIAEILEKMKVHGVSLPETGTGKNDKILARDLENALGDYFFEKKYKDDPVKGDHCKMRRSFTPMKAYRYDKLKPTEKAKLFDDDNGWFAEEKYNGWRIIITYIPNDGFCFWGGNISDVDFLPVDYTEHVLLNQLHPRDELLKFNGGYVPHAIDAEAVCFDDVETLDGLMSNNTLDAVGAILGSSPERAIDMQEDATLTFYCFDWLFFGSNFNKFQPCFLASLHHRKTCFATCLSAFMSDITNFKLTRSIYNNKQQYLNKLWKAGGEGIILKNEAQSYVSGGRLRTHAVKVKRTMSGEIGDDIDAFVSGWIQTPEYSKVKLIGGIELSVFINERGEQKEHHIATVTAMPDHVRQQLTVHHYDVMMLRPEYKNGVLVVDGQELSNRNRKIMHAKVDWNRGFRTDKRAEDCVLELNTLEEEKF